MNTYHYGVLRAAYELVAFTLSDLAKQVLADKGQSFASDDSDRLLKKEIRRVRDVVKAYRQYFDKIDNVPFSGQPGRPQQGFNISADKSEELKVCLARWRNALRAPIKSGAETPPPEAPDWDEMPALDNAREFITLGNEVIYSDGVNAVQLASEHGDMARLWVERHYADLDAWKSAGVTVPDYVWDEANDASGSADKLAWGIDAMEKAWGHKTVLDLADLILQGMRSNCDDRAFSDVFKPLRLKIKLELKDQLLHVLRLADTELQSRLAVALVVAHGRLRHGEDPIKSALSWIIKEFGRDNIAEALAFLAEDQARQGQAVEFICISLRRMPSLLPRDFVVEDEVIRRSMHTWCASARNYLHNWAEQKVGQISVEAALWELRNFQNQITHDVKRDSSLNPFGRILSCNQLTGPQDTVVEVGAVEISAGPDIDITEVYTSNSAEDYDETEGLPAMTNAIVAFAGAAKPLAAA